MIAPTVHSQVPERRACGPLHLNIRILEEEEDGLQGVAVDLPYICVARILAYGV